MKEEKSIDLPEVDQNSRIVMNKGDVQFLDENGNSIDQNLKQYFENKRLSNLTVTDEINIGDVVKLKGTGRTVVVEHINYVLNSFVKADFAGKLYNSDNKNLILFGAEDIEEVYSSNLSNKHL